MSQETTVAGAPALLVHRGSREEAARAGTALFFHGFGGSSADSERELVALAAAGLLAVGIDMVGHGRRRLPDFEERFHDQNPQREHEFLNLVQATAREVPAVVSALLLSRLARPDGLGVAGWSMGGFVAYAAVLTDPRIRAAAPILASPQWRLPWPDSPHRHADSFFPVALLSQTAELDRTVPPGPARALHEALKPYYAAAPHRLQLVEYPAIGHEVPHDAGEAMRTAMATWLRESLQPGGAG